MDFSNCSSGCRTGGHANWGECIRAKGTRVGWAAEAAGRDLTAEKKHFSRLEEYKAARRQGIRPDSTALPAIRRAVKASNETGEAYVTVM
jgi:hypothetical protein